jgi:hypothetical protein
MRGFFTSGYVCFSILFCLQPALSAWAQIESDTTAQNGTERPRTRTELLNELRASNEMRLLRFARNDTISLSLRGAQRRSNLRDGCNVNYLILLEVLSLRAAQVGLESAREAHERYKSEYENSQRLFAQSIISKKELDAALSDYAQAQQRLKQAEIQLEQTKLSFLANATHITIMEAKKYYDSQSRRMLDLVLRNASNLTQAESALGLRKDKIESASSWQNPEQIRALLNIENIIVSIVSDSSSIGKPYEEIIPVLPYGDQKKVTFELLTDVQEAGVRLSYLDQTVTERIYLEKESLQQIPTVIASQFSQEGQLGATIRYSLDLEMLVTSDTGFSLTVTNLPPQINYSFVESRSGARITSVRFTEQVSKHELALELSIP